VANILGYGDESQIAIWRITSKPVELFSKSYTDPRAES
jgi:hypothetical protein